MAQLQGRDPSAEVSIRLAIDDDRQDLITPIFELTEPIFRDVELNVFPDNLGIDPDEQEQHDQEIDELCGTIEDLTSSLQQLLFALDRHEPLDEYLSNAREILTTAQTKTPSLNGR